MKMTCFAHGGISKKKFVEGVRMINETFKPKISSIFHIERVNDGSVSQILCVKATPNSSVPYEIETNIISFRYSVAFLRSRKMGNNPCAYEKVSSDENFEISEKEQELLQISAEEGSITNHFDEKNSMDKNTTLSKGYF